MRWDRVFSIAPFGGLETPGFAGKKQTEIRKHAAHPQITFI